jgi:hypothetical protein
MFWVWVSGLNGYFPQILQYNMWDKTPTDLWDWTVLKEKIAK